MHICRQSESRNCASVYVSWWYGRYEGSSSVHILLCMLVMNRCVYIGPLAIYTIPMKNNPSKTSILCHTSKIHFHLNMRDVYSHSMLYSNVFHLNSAPVAYNLKSMQQSPWKNGKQNCNTESISYERSRMLCVAMGSTQLQSCLPGMVLSSSL